MKKISSIIVCFILHMNISAQIKDTLIEYKEIIIVDSISKDQLFINSREWFHKIFKSSKDVLQIIDKDNGQLAGKGILAIVYKENYLGKREYQWDCGFSIDIKIKDGKYKYTFTDFAPEMYFKTLSSSTTCPFTIMGLGQKKRDLLWANYKNLVDDHVKILIESLKTSMKDKVDDGF